MAKITSKEIKKIKEYLYELDELNKIEPPSKISSEEWDEFFKLLKETGQFPEKYRGRIGVNEIEVKSDIRQVKDENGQVLYDDDGFPVCEHCIFDPPEKQYAYHDIELEEHYSKYNALHEKYSYYLNLLLVDYYQRHQGEEEDEHLKTFKEIIAELQEFQDIQEDPEIETDSNSTQILDTKNLPNLVVTDKELQFAFTTYRNPYAYITSFEPENLTLEYKEDGEVIISSKAVYDAIEEAKNEEYEVDVTGIDHSLLRQLFSATFKSYLSDNGKSMTVNLTNFVKEMGIDAYYSNLKAEAEATNKNIEIPIHHSNNFFGKLVALEKLKGVWRQGSFYRVFTIDSYDAEENTLTFSSPWLYKIVDELMKKSNNHNRSIKWKLMGISSLLKPSIVSARSQPTVEIIVTLLAGLKQYGVDPEVKRHRKKKYEDKELVEYSISFKTLIERTPRAEYPLKKCTPSNKTTLLQRFLCGSNVKKRLQEGKGYILNEYIDKYTFIKDYYKDFEIIFQPPTINTLSNKVIIRHHGINGNFKPQNALTESGLFQDTTNKV